MSKYKVLHSTRRYYFHIELVDPETVDSAKKINDFIGLIESLKSCVDINYDGQQMEVVFEVSAEKDYLDFVKHRTTLLQDYLEQYVG
jgi:hypothetical protein